MLNIMKASTLSFRHEAWKTLFLARSVCVNGYASRDWFMGVFYVDTSV